MTLLIETTTPDFVMLSMDTLLTPADAYDRVAAAVKAQVAAPAPLAAPGARPAASPAGEIRKLIVLSSHGLVMAGAGQLRSFLTWVGKVAVDVPPGDILDLDAAAPAMLRDLFQDSEGLVVVHAAYSKTADRPLAFAYLSGDGFRSKPLDRGHTHTPAVDQEDPDFAELDRRWTPAAQGEETAEFHRLLARNLQKARDAGRYGPEAPCIGGVLHTARVDRDGITVKTSRPFASA